MEFLRELAEAQLPVLIYQPELIDQVRSYVSAGLILATLPTEIRARLQDNSPAQVLKITPEGKWVLKKYLKRPAWC
jgi:hypothetical protein